MANKSTRSSTKIDYIYLIRRRDGAIKIGVSKDPENRLRSFRTADISMQLLSTYPLRNAYDVELQTHKEFSAKNVEGEWFNLTADDLHTIQRKLNDLADWSMITDQNSVTAMHLSDFTEDNRISSVNLEKTPLTYISQESPNYLLDDYSHKLNKGETTGSKQVSENYQEQIEETNITTRKFEGTKTIGYLMLIASCTLWLLPIENYSIKCLLIIVSAWLFCIGLFAVIA